MYSENTTVLWRCAKCGDWFFPQKQALHRKQKNRYCGNDCYQARSSGTVEERFWLSAVIADTLPEICPELGPCWLWQKSTNTSGYGHFTTGSRKDGTRKLTPTHRFAYEIVYGPVPDDICILHYCDTPRCVNPLHLWTGTRTDNNHDRDQKGRNSGLRTMWQRRRKQHSGVEQNP